MMGADTDPLFKTNVYNWLHQQVSSDEEAIAQLMEIVGDDVHNPLWDTAARIEQECDRWRYLLELVAEDTRERAFS